MFVSLTAGSTLTNRVADEAMSDVDITRNAKIQHANLKARFVKMQTASWSVALQIKDVNNCNAWINDHMMSKDTTGA
jgi:hypothetical protein